MRTKIFVKSIVFNHEGDVLLLTRSKTDERRPGEQDYPGGGVEAGEDLGQAVCRELREEAGLTVDPADLRIVWSKTEIYNHTNIVRVLFWTRLEHPHVTLSFEHDHYQWVKPQHVSQVFPHPFYGGGIDYGLKHHLFGSSIR